MDEVYFCMALHKDEDMRHFLFSVMALQILENQCSPLWDSGKGRRAWKMLFTHLTFFYLVFSPTHNRRFNVQLPTGSLTEVTKARGTSPLLWPWTPCPLHEPHPL